MGNRMNRDDGTIYRSGSWAVEELAKRFGVKLAKALDPLNPADFVLICLRLGRALTGAAAGLEGDALREAIETLDVDWPNLTEAARDRVIEAARGEVAGLASRVPGVVEPIFAASAVTMVTNTRISVVNTYDLSMQLRHESPVDIDTIANVVTSQMVYVKDQYGVRADGIDAAAKQIVASGLERGLGRDDISEELTTRLGDMGVTRTDDYWKLIANDFANKGRTSTQLNTFERAEIDRFMFDAVMDQATSEVCRFLNGRIFSVEKAAKRMRHSLTLSDPEEIRHAQPWLQSGQSANGDSVLYFNRGGDRHTVAHVDEPGEGVMDRAGKYSKTMGNKELEAAGVTVPPRHSHCRSTIVTVD